MPVTTVVLKKEDLQTVKMNLYSEGCVFEWDWVRMSDLVR